MTNSVIHKATGTAASGALALLLALVLSACSSSPSASSTTTSQGASSTTEGHAGPTGTQGTQAGGAVATGSITCTKVTGTITFTPPITGNGSSAESTDISLTVDGCTTTGSNVAQVTGGTATATIKTASSNCSNLLNPQPVSVAVSWSPGSVHASQASFSSDGIVSDSAGHLGFGLPGSGGTATVTGSFAGSDNGAKSSATTYSTLTAAELQSACASPAGVASLTVASGSVTLS